VDETRNVAVTDPTWDGHDTPFQAGDLDVELVVALLTVER
jgi:hypothetical protein